MKKLIKITILISTILSANCPQPTHTANQNIINDMLKESPNVRMFYSKLKYYRVINSNRSFSFIVPSSFTKTIDTEYGLKFRGKTISSLPIEFSIKDIKIDKSNIQKHSAKTLIKVYLEQNIDKSSKVIAPLKIVSTKEQTMGRFATQIGDINTYYMFFLTKNHLYVITTKCNKQDEQFGKFVATLALSSFWSKYLCIDDTQKSENSNSFIGESLSLKVDNSCTKPSQEEDSNLIAKLKKEYPTVSKYIKRLKLKRVNSKDNTVSFIYPSNWKRAYNIDDETPINIIQKFGKRTYVLTLKKIPLDERVKEIKDKKIVIQIYAKSAQEITVDGAKEKGLKYKEITPFKYYSNKNITLMWNLAKLYDKKESAYISHSLLYDGKTIYDIIFYSDTKNINLFEFLSKLSAYSFFSTRIMY